MIGFINNKLELALEYICAMLMAFMVLDVTWQVLSRFVMAKPSSFSEELARFLLIWIGFLGAAYAFRKHAHLGLDILTTRFTGTFKVVAERFADLISFLFSAIIMVFGGVKIMILTLELDQTSAALQIPMGYVYSVIPLSGMLICLFALERIILRDSSPDSASAIN